MQRDTVAQRIVALKASGLCDLGLLTEALLLDKLSDGTMHGALFVARALAHDSRRSRLDSTVQYYCSNSVNQLSRCSSQGSTLHRCSTVESAEVGRVSQAEGYSFGTEACCSRHVIGRRSGGTGLGCGFGVIRCTSGCCAVVSSCPPWHLCCRLLRIIAHFTGVWDCHCGLFRRYLD